MHPRRVALVLSALIFLVALTAGVVRWTGDDPPSDQTPTVDVEPQRSPHALDPDGPVRPEQDSGSRSEPPGVPGG